MSSSLKPFSLRLPSQLASRASALMPSLAVRPEFFARKPSLAGVLRLAALRGLESLEAEHAGRESDRG